MYTPRGILRSTLLLTSGLQKRRTALVQEYQAIGKGQFNLLERSCPDHR